MYMYQYRPDHLSVYYIPCILTCIYIRHTSVSWYNYCLSELFSYVTLLIQCSLFPWLPGESGVRAEMSSKSSGGEKNTKQEDNKRVKVIRRERLDEAEPRRRGGREDRGGRVWRGAGGLPMVEGRSSKHALSWQTLELVLTGWLGSGRLVCALQTVVGETTINTRRVLECSEGARGKKKKKKKKKRKEKKKRERVAEITARERESKEPHLGIWKKSTEEEEEEEEEGDDPPPLPPHPVANPPYPPYPPLRAIPLV